MQAYRERVALQGGSDAGPLTEQADKRKILAKRLILGPNGGLIVVLVLVHRLHAIDNAVLHGAEWHYSLFAVLYVFVTVWAYQGYRNLLAYGRMVVKDLRQRTRKGRRRGGVRPGVNRKRAG